MHQPPPAQAPVTAPTLDAEVAIEDDRWHIYPDAEQAVMRAASALLVSEPQLFERGAAVTIVLSDDVRVTAMNARFRHKPVPTNVLSFPADPKATEPGQLPYLGDIVIARETVEREAGEQNISALHHLQHLAVHGLLHLLGYDHQTDVDAYSMEAIETRVLRSLGVADPYEPLGSQ